MNDTIAHGNTTQKNTADDSWHAQVLAWLTVILTTNALGTVANIILLLSLFLHRPLRRSSSSLLIAHCIITDIFTTAVVVPITDIPVYLGPGHRLPRHWCTYQSLYLYAVYPAGMWAACLLALHRFIATVWPQYLPVFQRRTVVVCMLIAPWVLSFAINILPAVEQGYKMAPSHTLGGCLAVMTGSSTAVYVLGYLVFSLYVPTFLTGLLYAVILVKSHIDPRRNRSRILRRRASISKTLFLSFVWHCVTIYPSIVLITFFRATFSSSLTLQLWMRLPANSFSAFNPVRVGRTFHGLFR